MRVPTRIEALVAAPRRALAWIRQQLEPGRELLLRIGGLMAVLLLLGGGGAALLLRFQQPLPAVALLLAVAVLGAILIHRRVVPVLRRLRLSQAVLRTALHRDELLLENAGEGIYGLDAVGCVTFVNQAAQQLLGFGAGELTGRPMHALIQHARRDGGPYPQEDSPILATLNDGRTRRVDDEVFWRKDGLPLEVEYVAAPMREAGRSAGVVVLFSDISARRRAETNLARWRHIFDHAEWGVVIASADGATLENMNPAFARMHGWELDTLTGRPVLTVVAPECHDQVAPNMRHASDKGHHVWESWHRRRDGSHFPVQLDVTAVKDAAGRVLYQVVNVQDISERKQVEGALRERERSLAQAQAQANLGSWWLDLRRNVLEWSDESHRIFGVPKGTPLTYESFLACAHPDDRQYVDSSWRAAMAGDPYDIQHRIVANGRIKWVRERADLEFDRDGTLARGIGTTQDITEIKLKEEELLRSRQMLRELAAHHEKIREEERARIAREIHDELGQYLTALRMDAAMLNIRFGRDNPELERHAAGMKQTIDSTIAVVRNVAAALRPGALDVGLVSAAEWLLAGFEERTGICCQLNAPQEDLDLDDARATAAFRILQESLTNVARHAQAGNIHVKLEKRAGELCMEVSDDGTGFDPMQVRGKKTFGLMGIRERAIMFGGESLIDSQPGGGTTLRVHIPLETSQPR